MKMKPMATVSGVLILALSAPPVHAQEHASTPSESYRVYSSDGSASTIEDIVNSMAEVDVVFVGETHDDPTGHWIEAELYASAYEAAGIGSDAGESARRVTLSLEFFQRDVQWILDEYLGGLISERSFLAASRPWDDYGTDYRPLIEFARENGLSVIAANAPRRYANRVSRFGRESLLELSEAALASLPPLPYGTPSDAYRSQWFRVMAEVAEEESQKCGVPIAADSTQGADQHDHTMMANQLHTQALWDASMAFSIAEHLLRNPGELVLHMVGSFHVERGTGIPEHLETYRPGTRRLIVVMRPVEDINAFDGSRDGENEDFVILTDKSMTRSEVECRSENPQPELEDDR